MASRARSSGNKELELIKFARRVKLCLCSSLLSERETHRDALKPIKLVPEFESAGHFDWTAYLIDCLCFFVWLTKCAVTESVCSTNCSTSTKDVIIFYLGYMFHPKTVHL